MFENQFLNEIWADRPAVDLKETCIFSHIFIWLHVCIFKKDRLLFVNKNRFLPYGIIYVRNVFFKCMHALDKNLVLMSAVSRFEFYTI